MHKAHANGSYLEERAQSVTTRLEVWIAHPHVSVQSVSSWSGRAQVAPGAGSLNQSAAG
jgi:hypothetical protein